MHPVEGEITMPAVESHHTENIKRVAVARVEANRHISMDVSIIQG